ncbi:exopolysaccharide production repressor protein [Sinorhizobium numidicum]|uniref:exopolysaccharide production repressor protein n=1 Tax=Sinorhizobium numidicum TaxID=680248 RepID=UPI002475ADF0|nr:exopolysaccharide production repressor protein [Sinorhizobium numidicum]
MRFAVFHRALWLLLCTNAIAVYFASHSIRRLIVSTLAFSLLLQLAYFGSVLFLLWRARRAEHLSFSRQERPAIDQ